MERVLETLLPLLNLPCPSYGHLGDLVIRARDQTRVIDFARLI